MNKPREQHYELTFDGRLRPGADPDRARRAVAELFGLGKWQSVDKFFTGQQVTLRRNLARRKALRLSARLRAAGLICTVVKAGAQASVKSPTKGSTKGLTKTSVKTPTKTSVKSFIKKSVKTLVKTSARMRVKTSAQTPAKSPIKTSVKTPAKTSAKTRVKRFAQTPVKSPIKISAKTRVKTSTKTRVKRFAKTPVKTPAPRPPRKVARAAPGGRAPNLFALRPAHPIARQQRIDALHIRALVATAVAVTSCALLVVISLRFPMAPATDEPRGPLAIGSLPGDRLLLLLPQAILVHERSGLPRERIDAAALGLTRLAAPLAVDSAGQVYLNGSLDGGPPRFLRCALSARECAPALAESEVILATAEGLVGAHRFLLNEGGELLLSNRAGAILARAGVPPPRAQPRLLAREGLLFLPASEGALLGVYRPDEQGFGQQLGALLLMPEAGAQAAADYIQDLALGATHHWALLAAESGPAGLYRFEHDWGAGTAVALDPAPDAYLHPWRDGVLVASASHPVVQRFSERGEREADFVSPMLADAHRQWLTHTQLRSQRRRSGIALALLVAAVAAALALLARLGLRALRELPEGRTALIDPPPAGLRWFSASAPGGHRLRHLGPLLAGLALLAVAALSSISGRLAASLIPAVLGGIAAWFAAGRGRGGHLGVLDRHAIVVDHQGRYFYGETSLLRAAHGWLLAPGVALPLARLSLAKTPLERCFSAPIPSTDARGLIGALWLIKHPWLQAGLFAAAGGLFSAALWVVV